MLNVSFEPQSEKYSFRPTLNVINTINDLFMLKTNYKRYKLALKNVYKYIQPK